MREKLPLSSAQIHLLVIAILFNTLYGFLGYPIRNSNNCEHDPKAGLYPNITVGDLYRDGPIVIQILVIHGVGNSVRVSDSA